MIEQRTLADIIQAKVPLGSRNPRGFYDVRCAVCHDHKDRGGFKFDDDFTGFSCYNCGAKFKYEEGSGKLSKNARDVLAAFGITKDDLTGIRSALFVPTKEEISISLAELKKVKLVTPEVPLPEKALPLGSPTHDELQAPIIEYLLSRRIDPLTVQAHFSLDKRYLRRAIIPFYRDGKVIYWQARAIDDDAKPRYLNSPAARDAVLYGYDELYRWEPTPLFVTEGIFDAIPLRGICLLGSSFNEAKLEVLKRCRRRLIFVVDRDRTGEGLGKAALENGWDLTFVDQRVPDVNRSIVRFGLPFTIYTLFKNCTKVAERPELALNLQLLQARLRGR